MKKRIYNGEGVGQYVDMRTHRASMLLNTLLGQLSEPYCYEFTWEEMDLRQLRLAGKLIAMENKFEPSCRAMAIDEIVTAIIRILTRPRD